MKTKGMSWSEGSSKGGKTTLKRHGKTFFQKNQKKSVETMKRKYGDDFFKELARKGLLARKKKKLEKAVESTGDSIRPVFGANGQIVDYEVAERID